MTDELTKEKKERLKASIFLFEQELRRGDWDVDEEIKELIKFAKGLHNQN